MAELSEHPFYMELRYCNDDYDPRPELRSSCNRCGFSECFRISDFAVNQRLDALCDAGCSYCDGSPFLLEERDTVDLKDQDKAIKEGKESRRG
jgi:hypothetical protein